MTHSEQDRTFRDIIIQRLRTEAANVGGGAIENHTFSLLNDNQPFWRDVEDEARIRLAQYPGSPTQSRVIREVAQEMFTDGILYVGRADQAYDWNSHNLQVSFTPRGIDWAQGNHRLRTNPNELIDSVRQAATEYPNTVTPGCVELVVESVQCIEQRCFRAAVVLVGVAAEEAATQLMEVLSQLTNYAAVAGWNDLVSRGLAFARRWAGAREVLAEVKQRIKGQLARPRPDWWSLWEGLPESLVPLGEAVRVSRNTAAHDADHRFTYLEAASLLCGLPHQLRWIAEIQDHIQNPRDGVHPD